MFFYSTTLLALANIPILLAAPAPAPSPAPTSTRTTVLSNEHPATITSKPTPTAPSLELKKRGLTDYLASVVSGLGSDIPSYVTDGVPNFFQGFPSGTAVQKSLSLSSTDVAALPTQVLNIPGYANWTESGWNLLLHGNVYKQPNISQTKLDDLANVFLIGTSISQLSQTEADQARNLTSEIFVIQQDDEMVAVNLVNNFVAPTSGPNGGLIAAAGGQQIVAYPGNTTAEGDFVAFVPLKNSTGPTGGFLLPGNATTKIQALNSYAIGSTRGNASAYLVPTTGYTVISDIDDILRVTKIYQPKEGLLNSFAKPFTPWMNMPEVYQNWSNSIDNFHFHYLTTTPEQVTANYMDYIYKTYPLGSFDTRPLNFSDVKATLSIRKFLLERIFQTFPERKFILVADTSNSDVMKDYPLMVTEFPNQVNCIFLRNTSSTDSGDKFPYDTSGFKGIDKEKYMFFNVPDDLKGLDIVNGQCVNRTVSQNVTFSYQGLPFGISINGSNSSAMSLLRSGKDQAGFMYSMAVMAVVLATLFSGL